MRARARTQAIECITHRGRVRAQEHRAKENKPLWQWLVDNGVNIKRGVGQYPDRELAGATRPEDFSASLQTYDESLNPTTDGAVSQLTLQARGARNSRAFRNAR